MVGLWAVALLKEHVAAARTPAFLVKLQAYVSVSPASGSDEPEPLRLIGEPSLPEYGPPAEAVGE
jgi:hypothetical protein